MLLITSSRLPPTFVATIGNLNNQNVCNEIISQEKYNEYIERIESIFNKYKEFNPPLSLSIFKKTSIINLRFIIIIYYLHAKGIVGLLLLVIFGLLVF